MRISLIFIFIFCSSFVCSQRSWDIQLHNETRINTALHEFSPIPWNNQFLFVSSSETNKNKDKKNEASFFDLKLTAIDLEGKMMGSALLPSIINSPYHEGPASYDFEREQLFFTRTNMQANALKPEFDRKVLLQIYSASYENNNWGEVTKWELNQEGSNYCHPSISKDGQMLVFASDKDNDSGKMDLYISRYKDKGWTEAVRLDSSINTRANECFPYLHPKGYLIFASNGHTEGQGLDLFISKIEQDTFLEPKLLPVPLNSNFDDFGFYASGNGLQGYMSSNRSNGMGKDDIYRFEATHPIFDIVEGTITHSTKVVKTDKKEKEPVISSEDKSSSAIDTKLGAVTIFDKIYYELNSHIIKQDAAEELDELVKLMKEYGSLKVQLGAHTDSRGSIEFNQDLSNKRALSARNYLILRGIESKRIVAMGFGETQIINHCIDGVNCTEEEHRKNRRTEVKILSN